MTPRQVAVLLTINSEIKQSQTDIVESTGIDRSTLSDIVRRMVDSGLMARRRDKMDARSYVVALTPKGFKTAKALRGEIKALDDRLRVIAPKLVTAMHEALASLDRELAREDA